MLRQAVSTNAADPPQTVPLERVTVWLESAQAARLREYARQHDRSLSNEARRMVRLYLRELDRREAVPR